MKDYLLALLITIAILDCTDMQKERNDQDGTITKSSSVGDSETSGSKDRPLTNRGNLVSVVFDNPAIGDIAEFHFISMQYKGPIEKIGSQFELLNDYVKEQEIKVGVPLGIYHGNPLTDKPDEMLNEAALILRRMPELTHCSLPRTCRSVKGMMASITHKGSSDSMGSVYQQLFDFIAVKGWRKNGPVYEFYLNSPRYHPQNELQVRIMVPVIKRGAGK